MLTAMPMGDEESEKATRVEVKLDISSKGGILLDYAELIKSVEEQEAGEETAPSNPHADPSDPGSDDEPAEARRKGKRREDHDGYDYEDAFIDDSDIYGHIADADVLPEDPRPSQQLGFFCWKGDVEHFIND